MRAANEPIERLLNQNNQYIVPEYQRKYTWRRPHWSALWAAVMQQVPRVVADETSPATDQTPTLTHFLGSVVLRPHAIKGATDVGKHDVIDGQQRLTTISIMLAALRDLGEAAKDRDKINDQLLANRYEDGLERYKLLPGPSDRDDYRAVIDGSGEEAPGLIGMAYRWFKEQMSDVLANDSNATHSRLETSIRKRLEIVDVTIEKDDNAHRVFQTLNSTGVALSAVDLLRNHFFMLLPTQAQSAYLELWRPMEVALGDKIDAFLLDELVARGGRLTSTSQKQVYPHWQDILGRIEHDESQVLDELKTLSARAKCYERLLDPGLATPGTSSRLRRLQALGGRAQNPLLLQALWLQHRSLLGDQDVVHALSLVEGYLVRRLLVGKPTNNLNRMLSTAAGQTEMDERFVASLHRALSASSFEWPSDETLRRTVTSSVFYKRPPQSRRYVLQRLEDAASGKEKVDWTTGNFQLEHVMPQTASVAWLNLLAESGEERPAEAHSELLHTLGNITLTAYNQELSNHPLERKQEILKDSKLHLNQALQSAPTWARREIHERGLHLIELAIAEWPGPVDVAPAATTEPADDVARLLALIDGVSWTTVAELAAAAERSSSEVEAALNASRIVGVERIGGDDGRVRTDWTWASNAEARHELLEDALGLGVIDSIDAPVAAHANWLTSAELVEVDAAD